MKTNHPSHHHKHHLNRDLVIIAVSILAGIFLAQSGILEKISKDTEPLEAANRATAHLYITNPFKGKKISKLFMTHPPIEERIKALRGINI